MSKMTLPGVTVAPDTETHEETHTRRVPPYNVILLNDDQHSMEFVVEVLCKSLAMSVEKAFQYMLHAHTTGEAVVWTAPKEVAELKAEQIQTFHEVRQRDNKQLGPLGVRVEPAPGA
jgi:ATP-dependent Clp protease adaptor protein ClpS